jgi:hypothetical protein
MKVFRIGLSHRVVWHGTTLPTGSADSRPL